MVAAILASILGVTLFQAGQISFGSLTLPHRQLVTAKLIDHYANLYQLPDEKKLEMYQTIACETSNTFLSDIKSQYPGEQSYGLAQINLPAHPEVTKEEANDPDFAVQFIVKHFAQSEESLWTCWRNDFGA